MAFPLKGTFIDIQLTKKNLGKGKIWAEFVNLGKMGGGGEIEQLKSGDQIQMNWSANGPETC